MDFGISRKKGSGTFLGWDLKSVVPCSVRCSHEMPNDKAVSALKTVADDLGSSLSPRGAGAVFARSALRFREPCDAFYGVGMDSVCDALLIQRP